jgi:hypothetical protein
MFFFQTMFQTVYNGITGSPTLTAAMTIGESILLLCALFAVYEAYARGGDVRALSIVAVRYLVMSLVISQYPHVFITVNDAANHLASLVSPTDVVTNWRAQFLQYFQSVAGQTAWYNMIAGGIPGLISILIQLAAVVIFPITYTLFSFFYSLYGAILYVFGPLVLALYPAFGIGQLARTYLINLLIWNSWGIIYAVMSQLLTLMNADSVNSILNAGTFAGFFSGVSQTFLLALSSILVSLMIALIPFIANRIVSGDVGSTFFSVLGGATAAISTVATTVAGLRAGISGGGGKGPDDPPPPPPPPGSDRAPKPPADPGDRGNGDSSGGQTNSSSTAPRAPEDTSQGRGTGGGPRSSRQAPSGLLVIPYAAGWVGGRAISATARVFGPSKPKEPKES